MKLVNWLGIFFFFNAHVCLGTKFNLPKYDAINLYIVG